MLVGMQQAMHTTTPGNAASFAGILEAMSSPAKNTEAWNDDGFEDDVTTLSYEHALRTHARYRQPEGDEAVAKKAVDAGLIRIREAFPAEMAESGRNAESRTARGNDAGVQRETGQVAHEVHDRDLKRASITVRLSAAECAQLHRRANEAGLTVSGYLRSCTFEAEALRAQVKETLSELRAGTGETAKPESSRSGRGLGQWLERVLHRKRASNKIAQVTCGGAVR